MSDQEPDPLGIVPYFVTDDDGVVIKSGTSQRMHLRASAGDGILHLGTAPQGRFKYLNGAFVAYTPEVSYEEARKSAYPGIEDQLDALWHAMDQGIIPKVEPMYSSIKEVKDSFPKPIQAE